MPNSPSAGAVHTPNGVVQGVSLVNHTTGLPTNASSELSDIPSLNTMVSSSFDAVVITYPTDKTKVAVYHTGGISGSTVATVTITYTDSSRSLVSSIVKT